MASTYLTRSVSSTGNRKKWTWSGWLKRGNLGSNYIMSSNNGSNQYSMLQFDSANVLRYYDYTSDFQTQLKTTRVFRDTSAWYHIVFAYDSAQSTASDRVKVYVNGTQETSFGTSSYPSQDYDSFMNLSGVPHYIGRETGTSNLYDGVMSHVHFTQGYVYQASDFGETDSTTGEWKINTAPSVSYGTNGYFMFKDDNSVNDDSGNGNNFTLTAGTLTKTEDCPSNVFATFNTLIKNHGATFTNGNTTYQSPASNPVFGSLSTLGMSSGKFYAECKYSAGSNHYLILGIADNNFNPNASTPDDLGKSGTTESIAYVVNTGAYRVNNNNTSWGSAGGDGDIIQIAVDCDNNKVFFGVNGTWGASSNPATGSNGIDVSSVLTGDTWFFGVTNDTGSNETVAQFNFGNGYFGTTAVSSAGSNASGIGIFEYDVPSGYTALSTKGLNL